MAAGREVRFPLLDHNVLIYGVAFSHEMKYRSGLSKYPLRAIIKRYLKDAYSAPKRSVVTPQSFWLRGKLKSWAFERADALKGKNVIDKRYFDRFDSFYERDEWDNSFYLWQIINLSYFFGSA
jgi:asparagine synthase (glutamine-hydrolysing)